LRALAPDTQFLQNSGYAVMRDTAWNNGLLFTVLMKNCLLRDSQGCLFHATVRDGVPQAGRTFVARRIPGTDRTRDIAVDGGRCAVLLAEDAQPRASIAISDTLERWRTVFEGDLPGAATSLAILNGHYYVGLNNGSILLVKIP